MRDDSTTGRFICDGNCLIYLLTCKCCGKQNVGKLLMNSVLDGALFEHFYSENHSGFLGNFSITLTDKTDVKDPKKRENYCMRGPKNHALFGLNYKDNV